MAPHDARRFFLYTTKPKIHHFSSLPLGVQENRNTISVRSASSILLGLDREFKQLFRFSFVVLLCLRSCGTAQVTRHDHCFSTASQLVESCVLSTRDATFVVYTPISCRESHHLVVSFTPTSSRSIRIGCVYLCVLLCRSVSRRTTVTRTPDNTGRSHDHSLVGAADRSLAPCAVIPRDDNQSLAVWTCWWLANSGSWVRFPFIQLPSQDSSLLLSCLYGPASSAN